jgi:hypothetical protein
VWNIRFWKCCPSVCTVWRRATKTSTITSNLRSDPLFGILAGREEPGRDLAGKSTLNRFEPGKGAIDRYKKISFRQDVIDSLLVVVFVESEPAPPAEIVLDIDTTDLPLHGKQEGRFFHGYYDSYCYLPLYVFCGDHVLCAPVRESNHDAAHGCLREIRRITVEIFHIRHGPRNWCQ